MALTSAAPSLRPVDRALVALSGAAGLILAILWWGSALVIRGFRLPRPQGRPDVQVILTIRPDWLLSQKGAPDALLFDSLHHYAPAVLLALFAFGLRRILRPGWPSVLPPALLLAAGISYLLAGAFPNDAGLYQDSPVRGAAGSAFVIAFPAAVVLGGVALRRSGWRGAGVWSLVAGIIMAWAVLLATALSAMAGTHQPQLSGALILQALASAWYLGMGVWLLLVSWGGVGRISDGRPALRFLRLVGAGLAVLSAAGLAGSAVLVGVSQGPTTLAQVTAGLRSPPSRRVRSRGRTASTARRSWLHGRASSSCCTVPWATATRRRPELASISRPTAWAGSLPIRTASQMVGTHLEMRAEGGAGIAVLTMSRS